MFLLSSAIFALLRQKTTDVTLNSREQRAGEPYQVPPAHVAICYACMRRAKHCFLLLMMIIIDRFVSQIAAIEAMSLGIEHSSIARLGTPLLDCCDAARADLPKPSCPHARSFGRGRLPPEASCPWWTAQARELATAC